MSVARTQVSKAVAFHFKRESMMKSQVSSGVESLCAIPQSNPIGYELFEGRRLRTGPKDKVKLAKETNEFRGGKQTYKYVAMDSRRRTIPPRSRNTQARRSRLGKTRVGLL